MGPFFKYRNLECPPGPPFNVGGEKRARAALASDTFSSTLIGGSGGRLTKSAQSDQCGRSLDRDAHQISHSVHLFSHFFATIDCNQNQRHLEGDNLVLIYTQMTATAIPFLPAIVWYLMNGPRTSRGRQKAAQHQAAWISA